jgi:hypothetical protein
MITLFVSCVSRACHSQMSKLRRVTTAPFLATKCKENVTWLEAFAPSVTIPEYLLSEAAKAMVSCGELELSRHHPRVVR